MLKASRLGMFSLVLMLIAGAGLSAQTTPSGAWLSGPVDSVAADSLTIQGTALSVTDNTRLTTVLPDGTFEPITIDQISPNDPFHGKMLIVSGTPTLTRGFVGFPFFWHGVVTAMEQDEEGNVLSIELDSSVTVYASQAVIIGKAPGSEDETDLDEFEKTDGDDAGPFMLQVGSTVGVAGIIRNGIYAAVVINVAAVDFSSRGTIAQLYRNENGHVIAFDLNRNGTTYPVKLTIYTRIVRNGHPTSADKLTAGQRVKTTGKVLADDSVLAYKVRVLR